jgi:REP element-mobilizing transposase RayT
VEKAVATSCIEQLLQSAALHDFEIPAYCVMPDHVHLLAYGNSLQADLRAFMIHFKKLTGFRYSRTKGRKLWQPGYYERILRDEESTEGVARYIFENPIRAGLTLTLGEYPYAGSETFDYRQV